MPYIQGTVPNWVPDHVGAQTLIDAYVVDKMRSTAIIRKYGLQCSARSFGHFLNAHGVTLRPRGTSYSDADCIGCGQPLGPRGKNTKLCPVCAPDKSWAARYYNYRMTKPQLEALYDSQSGLCDLCEEPLPEDWKDIRIDHCHKQGHVRALLDQKCNLGLHYIENDKFFAAAIKYVERHRK